MSNTHGRVSCTPCLTRFVTPCNVLTAGAQKTSVPTCVLHIVLHILLHIVLHIVVHIVLHIVLHLHIGAPTVETYHGVTNSETVNGECPKTNTLFNTVNTPCYVSTAGAQKTSVPTCVGYWANVLILSS